MHSHHVSGYRNQITTTLSVYECKTHNKTRSCFKLDKENLHFKKPAKDSVNLDNSTTTGLLQRYSPTALEHPNPRIGSIGLRVS